MDCATCGEPLKRMDGYAGGTMATLVGYHSPPGHDHDDNCRSRGYTCANGHDVFLSVQNRCTTTGCTWAGKLTCFCHKGEKLPMWPEETKRDPGGARQPGNTGDAS